MMDSEAQWAALWRQIIALPDCHPAVRLHGEDVIATVALRADLRVIRGEA